MANDYDVEHLITRACIYRCSHDVNYVYTGENEPFAEFHVPEVLNRDEILKQILDEIPFYVLNLNEHGKVYHTQIIIHSHENGERYIKPQNHSSNNIPGDYLYGICGINTWIGDDINKNEQNCLSNSLLGDILTQQRTIY
jgi:hypothetical protein